MSGIVSKDAEAVRRHLPDGSIEGLKLVHLQCHIGVDTLSWARLGAEVTGIDFSAESIRAALSEIIQSLLTAGLSITAFTEGKTIPWRALPSLVETPAGYVLPGSHDAVPLEFSLIARRER